MKQLPTLGGNVHAPVESVHVSVVHDIPSMHVVIVAHVAPAVHAPQPATEPSSQRTPVRGVQADVLVAGAQAWHELTRSTVPES
jgi:hypothetical protein